MYDCQLLPLEEGCGVAQIEEHFAATVARQIPLFPQMSGTAADCLRRNRPINWQCQIGRRGDEETHIPSLVLSLQPGAKQFRGEAIYPCRLSGKKAAIYRNREIQLST